MDWVTWLLTRTGLKPPPPASRSAELTTTAVTITTNNTELVHRLVVTQPLQWCDMTQLCTQCICDLVSSPSTECCDAPFPMLDSSLPLNPDRTLLDSFIPPTHCPERTRFPKLLDSSLLEGAAVKMALLLCVKTN